MEVKNMRKKIIVFLLLLSCFALLFSGCKKKQEKTVPAFNEETESTEDDSTEAPTEEVSTEIDPDAKILYLTFDDGPGPFTQHLLAILAKYDVKVTFFVTNFRSDCQYLLAREANEGHTVAVHSYTHEYSQIYSSTEAYWKDFNAMDDNIYQYTGKHTTVMRFPGGSSNTISIKYCSGIMSTLTKQMLEKGISYIDWDVDSGDASNAKTAEAVVNNLKTRTANRKCSVILCHDIKKYTVEAMETFIPWALENGYVFLPCTPDSEPARHTVVN